MKIVLLAVVITAVGGDRCCVKTCATVKSASSCKNVARIFEETLSKGKDFGTVQRTEQSWQLTGATDPKCCFVTCKTVQHVSQCQQIEKDEEKEQSLGGEEEAEENVDESGCQNITLPENSFATCSNGNEHGSICNFTCERGHILNGNQTAKCIRHENGTDSWNVDIPTCFKPTFDVLFLLDGSSSLDDEGFTAVKEWVKNLTLSLTDFARKPRIGVVQYSHYFSDVAIENQTYLETEIQIGQFNDSESLLTAIDAIEQHKFTTYTGAALEKVVSDFSESENYQYSWNTQFMILVTEGSANDPEKVGPNAAVVREMGVIAIAVGFDNADTDELRLIASGDTSSGERAYNTSTVAELPHITPDLLGDIEHYLSLDQG